MILNASNSIEHWLEHTFGNLNDTSGTGRSLQCHLKVYPNQFSLRWYLHTWEIPYVHSMQSLRSVLHAISQKCTYLLPVQVLPNGSMAYVKTANALTQSVINYMICLRRNRLSYKQSHDSLSHIYAYRYHHRLN